MPPVAGRTPAVSSVFREQLRRSHRLRRSAEDCRARTGDRTLVAVPQESVEEKLRRENSELKARLLKAQRRAFRLEIAVRDPDNYHQNNDSDSWDDDVEERSADQHPEDDVFDSDDDEDDARTEDRKELIRQIRYLQRTWNSRRAAEFSQREHAEIEKWQERAKRYRHFYKYLERQLQKKIEEHTNEKLPWKTCEICLEEYGSRPNNLPGVLQCGHTICLECVSKVGVGETSFIKCPICRAEQDCSNTKIIPNFALLSM